MSGQQNQGFLQSLIQKIQQPFTQNAMQQNLAAQQAILKPKVPVFKYINVPNIQLTISQDGLQNFEKILQNESSAKAYIFCIKGIEQTRFMDIPLSPIFEQCIQMDLRLKFIGVDQDDFDQFCQQLSNFINLQSFALRFYNKRIQNINSLLRGIQNIQDVCLKLEDFQKIQVSNLTFENYKTKWLKLQLQNASFKDDSLQNLTKFINSLQLDTLELKLNNHKLIEIFTNMNQILQIKLDLSHERVNMEFCDKLKCHFERLPNLIIQKPSPMIEAYLFDIGINRIYGYYNTKKTKGLDFVNPRTFYIRNFSDQDFIIMNQTPLFLNCILSLENKKVSITFSLFEKFLKQFFELIYKIDHLFPNITLELYSSLSINKIQNYWVIELKDQQQLNKYKYLRNLTHVKFILNFKRLEEYSYEFIKVLSKYRYLISFQLKQTGFVSDDVEQAAKLYQRKGEAVLRFIAFKKLFSDLIPLQHQVFYDLMDN